MSLPAPRGVAALVLPAILLLAACTADAAAPSGVATLGSGDSPSTAPGASAGPSLSPEDAALAFARCMREHGVDMPDPQVVDGGAGVAIAIGGDGVDPEVLQAAQEACQDLLGTPFGPGATLSPEDLDRMVAHARCMREHGIDMPDPDGNGAVMIGPGSGGIDPFSDEFKAANEACRHLLPGGGDVEVVTPGAGG